MQPQTSRQQILTYVLLVLVFNVPFDYLMTRAHSIRAGDFLYVRQGRNKFKGRMTIREVSPTSYTFSNEISIDGGPWTKIEEGKATKK